MSLQCLNTLCRFWEWSTMEQMFNKSSKILNARTMIGKPSVLRAAEIHPLALMPLTVQECCCD